MNGPLDLHPKVAATLLATWVTVLVVYSLHQWAHTDLPAAVSAALTGLVAFAAGWLAPSRVDARAAKSAPPAGPLCVLVAALALAGLAWGSPAASAASTQINAPANMMLHVGSHGQRVKDLQWLLGNGSPSIFRGTMIKGTFKGKPNGLFGVNTAKAITAYKWQLGYPKRMLTVPVAGPYFFELLTGKAPRPIAWVARAAKRLSAPATGPTALALKIRQVELLQLGVAEQPLGSNRGYAVVRFQQVTGAIGLAWCVSFQQWSFQTGGYGTFAYATASVYTAVDYAQARGLLRARPKVGAIVAFVDYDRDGHRIPGTGHMGYVVKVTVGGFVSIEGNASNRVLERYHLNAERPHVFIYLKGVA